MIIRRDNYIQSALTVAEESKRQQETNSLTKINDSFVKIVVVRGMNMELPCSSMPRFLLRQANKTDEKER